MHPCRTNTGRARASRLPGDLDWPGVWLGLAVLALAAWRIAGGGSSVWGTRSASGESSPTVPLTPALSQAEREQRDSRSESATLKRKQSIDFPEALPAWLQAIALERDEETKAALLAEFPRWLAEQIPAKRTRYAGLQTAVTNRGVLLTGIFQPQQGGVWYKHYRGGGPDEVGKQNYDYVLAIDLRKHPREALPATIARRYQQARAELLSHLASRAAWQTFADELRAAASDLHAFRAAHGVDVDLDFQAEIALADEVLADWQIVRPFLP